MQGTQRPAFRRRLVAGALVGALAAAVGARAQVVPLGPQFQVNSYTTGNQGEFGVGLAADASGNVVVVWGSLEPSGVRGQRYDSAREAVGGEFEVTAGGGFPAVASDAAGNFVVVWEVSGSYDDIQARRFDSTGTPLGPAFQVNTYTTGYQRRADVAMDPSGAFVVVWYSDGSGGSDTISTSIHAQRFDSAGAPLGAEIQVNTYTTSYQDVPRVALNAAGDWLVVWRSGGSAGTDASLDSVQGQRFDSAGTPLGGEFQVNSYTTSVQADPDVAVDTAGNFAVVWHSYGSAGTDTEGFSIQSQRYDAAGLPLGGEVQVNTYTTSGQGFPRVAADPTGGFVVVWDNGPAGAGSDTSGTSLQGQRFDGSGLPLGSQFQVNSYTTGDQDNAAVAPDPAGNFVVVWRSEGSAESDTSGTSVQGQREGPARVLGKKLVVHAPSSLETRRSVMVLGKETATDIGPIILGDPTVTGATLRIVTTGGTPVDQTYALDAAGWQPIGTVGYKYRGPTGGDGDPVARVRLKRTAGRVALLKVLLRGGIGTQDLDVVPPNPGDESLLALTINGGGTYCVAFGGAAGGTETDDSATRWRILSATAQACP